MAEKKPQKGGEPSEQVSYKGKSIKVTESEDTGTITVDGVKFEARRMGNGMWSSPGVFNHYSTLPELARHIADYFHQLAPGL